MHTCPDCGTIIMKGDPYCPHCGAHLVWSDDYQSSRDRPDIPYYEDDSLKEAQEYERKHQEYRKKICETYKVELEDLDLKDGYTEYIFLRKTPYYTLRIVATDQYGQMIGIKTDETTVDFTKLEQNRDFQEMVKNLGSYQLSVDKNKDVIYVATQDTLYQADMENRKLIVLKTRDEA